MGTRRFLVAGVILGVGLFALSSLAPAPAEAQSACGDRVVVSPGDTLAGIARRCGTTLSALIAANPSIDPNVIWPGMSLSVRIGAPPPSYDPRPTPAPGRYVVERGDTLHSIARRFGVPVPALVSLNPHINVGYLRVGDVLRIPGGVYQPEPAPQLSFAPARGRPGTLVELRGSGFEPHSTLRVLAGAGRQDLQTITSTRADWRGRIDVDVRVPDWARRGDSIVFAAAPMNHRAIAFSEPFRIEWRRHADRPGRVDMTGTLIRGGPECPAMRGDDGQTYSLLGETRGFRPGDRVHIEGRVADMSICMLGTAVEVRRISSTR